MIPEMTRSRSPWKPFHDQDEISVYFFYEEFEGRQKWGRKERRIESERRTGREMEGDNRKKR